MTKLRFSVGVAGAVLLLLVGSFATVRHFTTGEQTIRIAERGAASQSVSPSTTAPSSTTTTTAPSTTTTTTAPASSGTTSQATQPATSTTTTAPASQPATSTATAPASTSTTTQTASTTSTTTQTATPPDVIGDTLTQAEAVLEAAGWGGFGFDENCTVGPTSLVTMQKLFGVVGGGEVLLGLTCVGPTR